MKRLKIYTWLVAGFAGPILACFAGWRVEVESKSGKIVVAVVLTIAILLWIEFVIDRVERIRNG